MKIRIKIYAEFKLTVLRRLRRRLLGSGVSRIFIIPITNIIRRKPTHNTMTTATAPPENSLSVYINRKKKKKIFLFEKNRF